ncbi:lipopolysaccharide assembly protein LapA domain-containing protein [Mycobacterium sp. NPDC003323]
MTTDPHAAPFEPEQPYEPLGTSEPAPPPEDNVKFTRAAALWSSLIIGFLVLIVLLIFIAQNTDPGTFHFLGWNWTLPLGVALLLAAVGGGLLTVLVGAARIVQLRIAARKNLKAARRSGL